MLVRPNRNIIICFSAICSVLACFIVLLIPDEGLWQSDQVSQTGGFMNMKYY
jgi:hypothetical protein